MTHLKSSILIDFLKKGKNRTRTRDELFWLMNKYYIGKDRLKKQAFRMLLLRLQSKGIIKIIEGKSSFWGEEMKVYLI